MATTDRSHRLELQPRGDLRVVRLPAHLRAVARRRPGRIVLLCSLAALATMSPARSGMAVSAPKSLPCGSITVLSDIPAPPSNDLASVTGQAVVGDLRAAREAIDEGYPLSLRGALVDARERLDAFSSGTSAPASTLHGVRRCAALPDSPAVPGGNN